MGLVVATSAVILHSHAVHTGASYWDLRMFMVSMFILQAAGFGCVGPGLGKQATLQMECTSWERRCDLSLSLSLSVEDCSSKFKL